MTSTSPAPMIPGPRGHRDWWDDGPTHEPENPGALLRWMLGGIVVLLVVMWLGGTR